MKKLLFASAFAALLSGCATPTSMTPQIAKGDTAAEAEREVEYVLKARLAEGARVEDTSFKLFVANRDLCPGKRGRVGVNFANADEFKAPVHDVAVRTLGLTDSLRIIHVVPGSPAETAGLQVGDELVAANGKPVPTGSKAREHFGKDLADALEKSPSKLALSVRRAGQLRSLEVAPISACAYDVEVTEGPEVNAYADGKRIFVSRPMLRLAATDQELALVLAHELAHNARGHLSAQKKNAAMAGLGGAVLDVLAAAGGVNTQGAFTKAAMQAGAGYNSPEFEAEADYVGMYFMARAGYDTNGVENFWRKMAVENPTAIFIKSSHPATPSRYLAIAATNTEILSKRSAGDALVPNEKKSAK